MVLLDAYDVGIGILDFSNTSSNLSSTLTKINVEKSFLNKEPSYNKKYNYILPSIFL
jgi:hypothetical protein